jgi:CheY-like chemotaxis protein
MRALVADDNPLCRDVAAAQLSLLGFKVTTAIDGDDALAAIDRHGRFDLILVDWAMGPTDGHALIRSVRALPGAIDTCICLWTGDASQDRRDAAIRSGANAVLPKPFALRELASHLAQLGFRS